MRGRFITFEGGEGTGKSTQARLLAERIEACGCTVVLTREPGGSPGAEAIRHILLGGGAKPLGPDAEAILFAAARDDHVRSVIRPALEAGKWVISDRFADSTRVYQGVLGQVDAKVIRALERLTVGQTQPDLTFILDISPLTGLTRAARRRGQELPDRFESETPHFHTELRAAYRELAASEPERCILVDAAGTAADVAAVIWRATAQRLALPQSPQPVEAAS